MMEWKKKKNWKSIGNIELHYKWEKDANGNPELVIHERESPELQRNLKDHPEIEIEKVVNEDDKYVCVCGTVLRKLPYYIIDPEKWKTRTPQTAMQIGSECIYNFGGTKYKWCRICVGNRCRDYDICKDCRKVEESKKIRQMWKDSPLLCNDCGKEKQHTWATVCKRCWKRSNGY